MAKDLDHLFIHGTWQEYNEHKDEVPEGSIVFCEDVGKIILNGAPMNDIIEVVDKIEEDNK